jgi:hypothetical protein
MDRIIRQALIRALLRAKAITTEDYYVLLH